MRILALVYEREAGPGVFGEAMRGRGVELDEWFVPSEPEPPGDPGTYDAVMPLGGYMHTDQEDAHPWLRSQKRLVTELLESGTPLLGACLGAQLLAEAAGGVVRAMPQAEIGWYEIAVTEAGAEDDLLGPMAPRFTGLSWHSYECIPPAGATVLARSAACVQAYRIGELVWGIQFHAEVTHPDANLWMDDWRKQAAEEQVQALRGETDRRIADWNAAGRGLAVRFLEAVAARSPASR